MGSAKMEDIIYGLLRGLHRLGCTLWVKMLEGDYTRHVRRCRNGRYNLWPPSYGSLSMLRHCRNSMVLICALNLVSIQSNKMRKIEKYR